MTRRQERERARRRAHDLAVLRDAIAWEGRVCSTDREVRRLVRLGYAERPEYAYGAARDAFADITDAGRRFVAEAAR